MAEIVHNVPFCGYRVGQQGPSSNSEMVVSTSSWDQVFASGPPPFYMDKVVSNLISSPIDDRQRI